MRVEFHWADMDRIGQELGRLRRMGGVVLTENPTDRTLFG